MSVLVLLVLSCPLAHVLMCVFAPDMLRVSEGSCSRPPRIRSSQRSSLSSVLQFLGNSALPPPPAPPSGWLQLPVCRVFQSPGRQPRPAAPTGPRACRRHPLDACSPPSHTGPTACWENAATTTTAGRSQRGVQVQV